MKLPPQAAAQGRAMSVTKAARLALVHRHLIPPETVEEGTDLTAVPWRTEYDVVSDADGEGPRGAGARRDDDLGVRDQAAGHRWKPHIAFKCLEGFDDIVTSIRTSWSTLELLKLGPLHRVHSARPAGWRADKSRDRRSLLAYHSIPVRSRGRPNWPNRSAARSGWTFRPIVEIAHAGGIESASRRRRSSTPTRVKERVQFIHESIGTAAIVAQLHRGPGALSRPSLGNQRPGTARVGAVFHQCRRGSKRDSRPTA